MSILEDIASTIPKPTKTIAIVCLIINIILPGIGTIIAACISKASSIQIIVGIAQIPCFSSIVGWVSAIYWGYRMLKSSDEMQGDFKGNNKEFSPKTKENIYQKESESPKQTSKRL